MLRSINLLNHQASTFNGNDLCRRLQRCILCLYAMGTQLGGGMGFIRLRIYRAEGLGMHDLRLRVQGEWKIKWKKSTKHMTFTRLT